MTTPTSSASSVLAERPPPTARPSIRPVRRATGSLIISTASGVALLRLGSRTGGAGRALPMALVGGRGDPVGAAVNVVRIGAVGVAGYLAVISFALLVASLTRSVRLGQLTHRVMLPSLRSLLPITIGVGLTLATSALTVGPAGAATPLPRPATRSTTKSTPADGTSPPTTSLRARTAPTTSLPSPDAADVMTRLPDGPPDSEPVPRPARSAPDTTSASTTSTPTTHTSATSSDDTATFHLDTPPAAPPPAAPSETRRANGATSTTGAPKRSATRSPRRDAKLDARTVRGTTRTSPGTQQRATRPRSVDRTDAERPPTWTVSPGDHLWGIAATTLRHRLGRTPTDAEIAPYWHSLIDANRARLADRDNPDLIFPGQIFDLPQ